MITVHHTGQRVGTERHVRRHRSGFYVSFQLLEGQPLPAGRVVSRSLRLGDHVSEASIHIGESEVRVYHLRTHEVAPAFDD